MNAGMNFIAVVSLLLALATAGAAVKDQAKGKSPDTRQIRPSKIVLNHSETMMRDAKPVQQLDAWAQWLTSLQLFVFDRVSSYASRGIGGCEEFGCGGNHSETFVQDLAATPRPVPLTW